MVISVSTTLPYPADEVRKLVRLAARHVGLNGSKSRTLKVTVKRKNHRSFNGWAYQYGYVPGRYKTVTLGIDPSMDLPLVHKRYGREYVTFTSWQEVIVFIAGHELCHIQHSPGTEKMCEWYGWYALHQYRQGLGVDTDLNSYYTPGQAEENT